MSMFKFLPSINAIIVQFSGIAVVYSLGHYRIIISTRTHVWYAAIDSFELNIWTTLSISWHIDSGLGIFVNGRFITRVLVAIPRTTISVNTASELVIGGDGVHVVVEDIKVLRNTAETCAGAQLIRLGTHPPPNNNNIN